MRRERQQSAYNVRKIKNSKSVKRQQVELTDQANFPSAHVCVLHSKKTFRLNGLDPLSSDSEIKNHPVEVF